MDLPKVGVEAKLLFAMAEVRATDSFGTEPGLRSLLHPLPTS